jgi:hypothetical protein
VQALEVQGWDSEARERAMEQAKKLAMRDPDAAELLLAQLRKEEQAAKERPPEISDAILRKVYRPTTLLANMAMAYRWSWESMQNMDYVAFFVMAEEAEEIQKKRNKAINGNHDTVSEQEVHGWLPATREYEGPTTYVR